MATQLEDILSFQRQTASPATALASLLDDFANLLQTMTGAFDVYLLFQPNAVVLSFGEKSEIRSTSDNASWQDGQSILDRLLPNKDRQTQSSEKLVSKVLHGPFLDNTLEIPEGQAAVLHVNHFALGNLFALLVGKAALASPSERVRTHQLIQLSLDLALERFFANIRTKAHAHRQKFYDAILSTAPETPAVDHQLICNTWKSLLNATSVWLWIFNQYTNQWELLAVSAGDESSAVLAYHVAPSKYCVAEYCNLTAEPEYLPRLELWSKTFGGKIYSVACVDQFKKLGYVALDCVPLPFPEILKDKQSITSQLPLRAAICAHYSITTQRSPQLHESLHLMAKVSALALINSYQSEQREILLSLNQLNHKYLSAKAKRPDEIRHQYLSHVIDLIRKRLCVDYVSIFYRDEMGTKVNCLATTGLWDGVTGSRIVAERAIEAVYLIGEHRTGKVFQDARPCIQKAGDLATPKLGAKYRDTNPQETDESTMSWILYPIPSPSGHSIPPDEARANGVIRCSGNRNVKWQCTNERNFDPVQVQTLDFIAQVIGPPLETMAAQVSRETAVNYIKHDLYAPVEMISSSLEELEKWIKGLESNLRVELSEGKISRLNDYFLYDLTRALVSLEELVHRLDPDPTIIDRINPISTWLEGDIMARLRAMLANFAWRRYGMTLRFGGFECVPALDVDRFLIERVFTNLIINAMKYGQKGTEIMVEARSKVDGYYVTVSNYGAGIDAGDKELIFKGQFRSEWAKKKELGAGLGLKISRRIMENHGGRLYLESAKGPTVFSLFFPRALESLIIHKDKRNIYG